LGDDDGVEVVVREHLVFEIAGEELRGAFGEEDSLVLEAFVSVFMGCRFQGVSYFGYLWALGVFLAVNEEELGIDAAAEDSEVVLLFEGD
jgi:hypothetical protein